MRRDDQHRVGPKVRLCVRSSVAKTAEGLQQSRVRCFDCVTNCRADSDAPVLLRICTYATLPELEICATRMQMFTFTPTRPVSDACLVDRSIASIHASTSTEQPNPVLRSCAGSGCEETACSPQTETGLVELQSPDSCTPTTVHLARRRTPLLKAAIRTRGLLRRHSRLPRHRLRHLRRTGRLAASCT